MPTRVAIAIRTMAKHRRTGVLYDSDDPKSVDRIAFPNKHFDPGWKPFGQILEDRKAVRAGGDPSNLTTPQRPAKSTRRSPSRVRSGPGNRARATQSAGDPDGPRRQNARRTHFQGDCGTAGCIARVTLTRFPEAAAEAAERLTEENSYTTSTGIAAKGPRDPRRTLEGRRLLRLSRARGDAPRLRARPPARRR